MPVPLNLEIAARFAEVAELLAEQGASRYRVEAYRHGAETLRGLARPVSDILRDEGVAGLERLPAIGEALSRAIRAAVEAGRLPMLDRLRGETDAVRLLASVPGIGGVLADRLHHELGIDTLEALEAAACDGRLAGVARIGAKRLAGIRDSLAQRLGRIRAPAVSDGMPEPPITDLLAVDREYRTRAAEGSLRTIAPRRFNPRREAWLPVLHTERGGRDYTALFSNTERAHELGRTRDWVVLYVDGGRGERRYTAVTAPRGVMMGRRIVRGREAECLEYYRQRGLHLPAEAPDYVEA
jgi:DNA polymerase (family 10)